MKIRTFFPTLIIGIASTLYGQSSNGSIPPLTSFDLNEVRLLDSPFKQAELLDIDYLLTLDADRLLAPYQREAGIPSNTPSYTNWENTGLDGHIGGHYVSALSLMYASTGDERIRERLDYMLLRLQECQAANKNGYLGGVPRSKALWDEIANGQIHPSSFSLNDGWVPLYNIHKIYAGLRDAWLYAKREDARDMLIKLSEWAINLVKNLDDKQIQSMLRSEHGGLNEIFADVAAITGDDKYLTLARRFSHRQLLEPLLRKEDKLTGMHANTQIPKVIGFQRIAEVSGDSSWHNAALFFWETVAKNRSVSIGGNSTAEHFHPTDNFNKMLTNTQGPETCNTYNMIRLSKMLYLASGEERFMDFYERALYNHILSSQNPQTGGLVYFTPMRNGHYRVYSQPHTSMWCCVGSGIENHAKYGEMIYARHKNDLYVNLFIPSALSNEESGLEVIQENNFPEDDQTTITINPRKQSKFTLYLRYPQWVGKGKLGISVNDEPIETDSEPGTYIPIYRKWKKGDVVKVSLPMHLCLEQIPDKTAYYSIKYGPIVLAAELGKDGQDGLFADDSRGGHIAHGKEWPLQQMPTFVGSEKELLSSLTPIEGEKLTFSMKGVVPVHYSPLKFQPFFRLHESRYMIYVPLISAENYQQQMKELKQQEEERTALNSRTFDWVTCGEQQPESDHFIKMSNSITGKEGDRQWRMAEDWFTYEMQGKGIPSRISITYNGNQPQNANFRVFVQDCEIAHIHIDPNKSAEVFTEEYQLPEIQASPETTGQKFHIKVAADEGSVTARICEIRLLF